MLAALAPGLPVTSSQLAERLGFAANKLNEIFAVFRWGCEHQKVVGAIKSLLALPQQMVLAELSSEKR